MYCDHGGTEAILLERCILVIAFGIMQLEFVDDGLAQHTFTLAVDEDNLLPLGVLVGIHGLTEDVELMTQHVGVVHAGCAIDELVDVQIDLDDAVAQHLVGIGLDGLMNSALALLLLLGTLVLCLEQLQFEIVHLGFQLVNPGLELAILLLEFVNFGHRFARGLLGTCQRGLMHGGMACLTIIVLLADNDTLRRHGWDLKSVFVFHHHKAIAVEAFYDASSLGIEEPDSISDFHFRLYLGTKIGVFAQFAK